MGITPEMIEQMEARLRLFREAGIVVDKLVTSDTCHNEAPRVVCTREINGRTAEYIATPTECVLSNEGTFFATTMRIEQRMACAVQCVDVRFCRPALIKETGVYIRVTQQGKGRQRFQVPGDWRIFDIGLPFIGSKETRSEMKRSGVSIKKQPCGSIA